MTRRWHRISSAITGIVVAAIVISGSCVLDTPCPDGPDGNTVPSIAQGTCCAPRWTVVSFEKLIPGSPELLSVGWSGTWRPPPHGTPAPRSVALPSTALDQVGRPLLC